jgi:hypothetical protein
VEVVVGWEVLGGCILVVVYVHATSHSVWISNLSPIVCMGPMDVLDVSSVFESGVYACFCLLLLFLLFGFLFRFEYL